MVESFIVMEQYMLVNLEMENMMEMVYILELIKYYMKENGKRVKEME